MVFYFGFVERVPKLLVNMEWPFEWSCLAVSYWTYNYFYNSIDVISGGLVKLLKLIFSSH